MTRVRQSLAVVYHILDRMGWGPILAAGLLSGLFYLYQTDFIYEPPFLLPLANFLFITCVCLSISVLAARSYLHDGAKSVLLLGCGSLFYALVGGVAGILVPLGTINEAVTVYNLGLCLSGLSCLAGVMLALTSVHSLSRRHGRGLLILSYAGVLTGTGLLSWAAFADRLPVFFVQGTGATPIRQNVLVLSIVAFLFCSLLLVRLYQLKRAAFLHWYARGLVLLAVGMLDVLLIDSVGSPLGWMGRLSQYLGCLYLLGGVLIINPRREGVLVSLEEVLHEKEKELRRSRADLKRAQAVSHTGSWRIDVLQGTLTWSDENYRIFGIAPGTELNYQVFFDRVHPDDLAAVKAMWSAAKGGKPYDIEHRILVDGAVKWVRGKADLEYDAEGNLTGAFGTTQDITELKETERMLVQARHELEARVRERTEELGRMVQTLAEEVEKRIGAEEQLTEMNTELEKRAGQLSRLASELTLAEQKERQRLAHVLHDHLQQLLVAAKLEIGMLARRADAEQKAGLQAAVELIEESIRESRSLTVELAPPILKEAGLEAGLKWLVRRKKEKYGLQVRLSIDPAFGRLKEDLNILLFQSARELLFNAVKHAGTDRAELCLGRQNGHLVIDVRDDGKGFDPERMWSRAAASSGGFGLFSIRERLSRFGGRLEVESRPGEGSRFRMLVPVETCQAAARSSRRIEAVQQSPPMPAAAGGGDRIRLLLVDDHSVMRRGLASMLRLEEDIEIVGEAADGREAVRLAGALRPDIILMDFGMPEMNGVEATETIHGQYPGIRIIGLSMFEEADRAAAMLQAGAVSYVSKSESPDVVLSVIRSAYAGRGGAVEKEVG